MGTFRRVKGSLILATLGCLPATSQAVTQLSGIVLAEAPFSHAQVTITDRQGKSQIVHADSAGRYRADIQNMQAPLLLSAQSVEGESCLRNDVPRARCMASLLLDLQPEGENIANITPFSDRMVSEVAEQFGYPGPQQWVINGLTQDVSAENLAAPLTNFRQGMAAAFANLGEDVQQINPVTTPITTGDGTSAILALINHNRNYDNNTGQAGRVTLTDSAFRPIVGLLGAGPWEPFDFKRAVQDQKAMLNAKTRIFIVSDSTAASYEVSRFPRMGWGQVFAAEFVPDAKVAVVNGARAGRSSRDFFNEGWYQQMVPYLQPGDYVFIAHGHNDQNCNGARPTRGLADVTNLCTYPNDEKGQPQYPEGAPEMAFQHALERYIQLAREKGAIPVLFTPTTRVKNAQGKTAFQTGPDDKVVSSHFTPAKPGYAYSGDYIATIKQTAAANQVPVIDLEKMTIDFANRHADDWMDYWLAVDEQRYPNYKHQTSGTRANPDTTHFQQKGAVAVANMVAEGIRQTPELRDLANQLLPKERDE